MKFRKLLIATIAASVSISATANTITVVTKNANIRSGPGTEFEVVTTVPLGTSMNELGLNGKWYKIRMSNNSDAWISQSTVRVETPPPKNDCRTADAAAVATGAFGGKVGGTLAAAACCAATLGIGCILCVGAGIAIGAGAGAKAGETVGEVACD